MLRPLLLLLTVLPASALAAPLVFTHQGRLLDAGGEALEGDTALTFSLYAASAGGDALWSEVDTVPLNRGYFVTQLGDGTPLDPAIFNGSSLWLGIAVEGSELPARVAIVSVPYAQSASVADKATLADRATNADRADRATAADTADRATLADEATHAASADSATTAESADTALTADSATLAAGLSPGAALDAASLAIGGAPVIDNTGAYLGTIPYNRVTGAPTPAADSDTLKALTCSAANQTAIWNGSSWTCGALTAAAVGAIPAGGALPVGASSATCNSAAAGSIRYVAASQRLEFCNGTVWMAITAGITATQSGGVYSWANGTVASGCWQYRSPGAGYEPALVNGVYRVDPDGSGSVPAHSVYCDMTTDGGGWTLVDNDATNAATFGSRTAGANTDINATRGAYLPGYTWSSSPQLLCKSSTFTGSAGWVTFNALNATAKEYPTVTTTNDSYAGTGGHWSVAQLNGNTNQGVASWIYNGSSRFGSVWIGNGGNSTCSCNYTGASSGLGTHVAASTNTCSTWVR